MSRVTSGEWVIEHNPKPIPLRSHDYDFWRDGYVDLDSPWHGTAASVGDALDQIAAIEAEQNE